MISDILFDATEQIEEWQKVSPDIYDAWRDHIELVKKVMASLKELLDQPPFEVGLWYERLLRSNLSEDQKRYWRACCEAGVARWAERLRLLEPDSPEGLVGRLEDGVERQDAMQKEPTKDTDIAPIDRDEE